MSRKNSQNETGGRRRLWVLTELYYPEETSTGYYLTRIAEGLATDFEVSVICGQPNYAARGVRAPKRERHKEVEIYRTFGTTFDKNIIFLRLINMLTLSFSMFFKALRSFRRGDQVLVVTTPPSLPFIAAAAALVKGAAYNLLVHDNYPEILVAVKKAGPDSMFVSFLNFLNRWLYKYAAKIIAVGRDMAQLLERKTEGLDIPIVVIPNWAELEQVEPRARTENSLIGELGIGNKFIFLYAGNMGYPNDLESIVECAEKLVDDERFCFLFLGAGVKRKWLENEVSEKSLRNVIILDPRPRTEQSIFLNACDVGIVTLVEKMRGVSMPSRTYNILAAGKPILALTEKNSELDLVVREDEVGWSVLPGAPAELLEKIREIYGAGDLLTRYAENARRTALDKYSLNDALEKYRKSLI